MKHCKATDCAQSYSDSESDYCSATCKRRAKRQRMARREQVGIKGPARTPSKRVAEKIDLSQIGRCPKMYKRVFRTWDEAYKDIARLGDPELTPYHCPCGAIHIGHPSTETNRRQARQKFAKWLSRQGAGNADDLDTVIVQGSTP